MDVKGPIKDTTSSAKANIDHAADQLQSAADRATGEAGAVAGNLKQAVDKSLNDQPYTTLALAALMGIAIGAIWKS